jgi:hypothetical protein
MRLFIGFLSLFVSVVLVAKEIPIKNCSSAHPVPKCKSFYFETSKGALVSGEVYLDDKSASGEEAMESTLYLELRYLDQKLFFDKAQNLYPYIGITTSRIYANGKVETKLLNRVETMPLSRDPNEKNRYRLGLSMPLTGGAESYESVDRVAIAFTNVLPHSGSEKWDSDNHNNFTIPVGLVQSWKKPKACTKYGGPDACKAAGCVYDWELKACR